MAKNEEILEICEGESIFQSHGMSRVKVTKEGKVKAIPIPIKSTGISELIDSFRQDAPQPPTINKLIKPEDEMGKELGINIKKHIKIPDYTDADYIKAKEDHDSDLGMAIVAKGLAVNLKDKEGKVVTEIADKIRILKQAGLSGDQFSQIVEDIISLTKWSDGEKESFFV